MSHPKRRKRYFEAGDEEEQVPKRTLTRHKAAYKGDAGAGSSTQHAPSSPQLLEPQSQGHGSDESSPGSSTQHAPSSPQLLEPQSQGHGSDESSPGSSTQHAPSSPQLLEPQSQGHGSDESSPGSSTQHAPSSPQLLEPQSQGHGSDESSPGSSTQHAPSSPQLLEPQSQGHGSDESSPGSSTQHAPSSPQLLEPQSQGHGSDESSPGSSTQHAPSSPQLLEPQSQGHGSDESSPGSSTQHAPSSPQLLEPQSQGHGSDESSPGSSTQHAPSSPQLLEPQSQGHGSDESSPGTATQHTPSPQLLEPQSVVYDESDSSSSDEDDAVLDEPAFNITDLVTTIQSRDIRQGEVLLLIVVHALRHNISGQALLDYITILNCLLGAEVIPPSLYLIDKVFKNVMSTSKFCFFCNSCYKKLTSVPHDFEGSLDFVCLHCSNSSVISFKSTNFFVILDLSQQFKQYLELPLICDKVGKMSDVNDCQLYKNLVKNGLIQADGSTLTYNFNTDGASVFNSSKSGMWPIQLVINELPPKIRFKQTILGGIWFGKSEPILETFMEEFVDQALKLYDPGVRWTNGDGQDVSSKFIPISCCVDSVARPVMQASTQFNGYFGCSYCLHKGVYVENAMKWPVDVADYRERTHADVLADANKAVGSGTRVNGIKGISPLSLLPGFDLVWGLPPDYMHGALIGVTKQLTVLWMSASNLTYYIGSPWKLRTLDLRISLIKPPQTVHRTPRSFKERSLWKASEWKMWILFYFYPCLVGLLGPIYLHHVALLSKGLFLLLQPKVNTHDLTEANELLHMFVGKTQVLYKDGAMTFNVHLLTHLAKSVKMSGPLWSTSTFPFESGIHNIKKYIKGPKGVMKQVVKKVIMSSSLPSLANELQVSDNVLRVCKQISSAFQLTSAESPSDVRYLGVGHITDNPEILPFITDVYDSVLLYSRFVYNGVKYHSTNYTYCSKSNDTVVQLVNGSFLMIDHIVSLDRNQLEECLLLGRSLVTIPLVIEELIMPHIFICTLIDTNLSTFKPHDIKSKCMWISFSNAQYVCIFPNDFEVQ